MLKLLERNIASIENRLVLLAPPHSEVPEHFRNVSYDMQRHQEMVMQIQQLRGSVYLQDGAVRRDQLSPDGLHRTPEDDHSWHLLMLNRHMDVSSCVWYLQHDEQADFESLRVRNCPLTRTLSWHERVGEAVRLDLQRARAERLRYAEVGGWAVARESRCTSEGLLLALAAYSLGRALGGALGLTTATVRHSSSTILRRIGGSHLEVEGVKVPPYYDPKYRCEMELLRFDSRRPNAKYASLIELLKDKLANVAVIAANVPLNVGAEAIFGQMDVQLAL
jgi:hypothetical protein